MYMLALGHLIKIQKINFFYADDTQVYIKTKPDSFTVITKLNSHLQKIRALMSTNIIQLNGSKTEALLIGTPY